MKTIKIILYTLLTILLFFCSIYFKSQISNGVINGINYCLNILIPSLFPMIFIASFAVNSPFNDVISKIFSPFFRIIFKIPQNLCAILIFSLCCGYPVGAKLCSKLLEKNEITKKEALNFLMFCVNPGIPFAVIFVGINIFGDILIGWCFFICTSIASLLIAYILGVNKPIPKKTSTLNTNTNFVDLINISAKSSLSATMNMCLYVVIFSGFLPVLKNFLLKHFTEFNLISLIYFFFDVTKGVSHASNFYTSPFIYIIGLSFAGLCVHFQVFSLFKLSFKTILKFYFYRILHIFISLFLFKIAYRFLPQKTISVFSNFNSVEVFSNKANITGSICLILLSLTFIFSNIKLEKSNKV